jgi:hypothetical protein
VLVIAFLVCYHFGLTYFHVFHTSGKHHNPFKEGFKMTYKCYQMTESGVQEFQPRGDEIRLGEGLGKVIRRMLQEMDKEKKPFSVYQSPVVGEIVLRRKRVGKAFQYTIESEMGFSYQEFRVWLAIAMQYLTGEYPVMSFSYDNTKVDIRRMKGGVVV